MGLDVIPPFPGYESRGTFFLTLVEIYDIQQVTPVIEWCIVRFDGLQVDLIKTDPNLPEIFEF